MKNRQAKKLARKLDILTGPTGSGLPIWMREAMERDGVRLPRLGPKERREVRRTNADQQIAWIKQTAFARAYEEVLGEPYYYDEEWNPTGSPEPRVEDMPKVC